MEEEKQDESQSEEHQEETEAREREEPDAVSALRDQIGSLENKIDTKIDLLDTKHSVMELSVGGLIASNKQLKAQINALDDFLRSHLGASSGTSADELRDDPGVLGSEGEDSGRAAAELATVSPEAKKQKKKKDTSSSDSDDSDSDSESEPSESASDASSSKKSRKKKPKMKFPTLPSEKGPHALTQHQAEMFAVSADIWAMQEDHWDPQLIVNAVRDTPYEHEISEQYNNYIVALQASLIKCKTRTERKRKTTRKNKRCFKKMCDIIKKDTVLVKKDAQVAFDIVHFKMRDIASKLVDCTIPRFCQEIKKRTSSFDISNPQLSYVWSELVFQAMTPVLREAVKNRLDEDDRRVDSIVNVLTTLSRDLSSTQLKEHEEQLKLQEPKAAAKAAVPDPNPKKPTKDKKEGLANTATLSDPSAPPKKGITCFRCGHDHFNALQKTSCLSPPNEARAALAKAQFGAPRKKSEVNVAQISKVLDNILQNGKDDGDANTAEDKSEKLRTLLNAQQMKNLEELSSIIKKNGSATVAIGALPDASKVEVVEDDDSFLRELATAELPRMDPEQEGEVHLSEVLGIERPEMGIRMSLRTKGLFYQPVLLANGQMDYDAEAMLLDIGADNNYIARELAEDKIRKGLVIHKGRLPYQKQLNGVTAGENRVEFYVFLYVYDGLNLEPRCFQVADTGGKIISGTTTTDECDMRISTKQGTMEQHQRGHAIAKGSGFPFTIENQVKRKAQTFRCFRSKQEAKERAMELWAELKQQDLFLEPRHPHDVCLENRTGTTLPRTRVPRKRLAKSWVTDELTKENIQQWSEDSVHVAEESVLEAHLGNAEEFTLLGDSSMMVRLQLEEPLKEGQAFRAISSGNEFISLADSGVSSMDPDNPKQVTVILTNDSDQPFVVNRRTTLVKGEALDISDQVAISPEEESLVAHVAASESPEQEVPEGVETEETSEEHLRLANEAREFFAKLEKIPITYTYVVFLFSGPGGLAASIDMTCENHGCSWKPCLAVDNDPHALEVHRRTFPEIPVKKWELGQSHKKTYEMIEEYLPRSRWHRSMFVASVDCKKGSSANVAGKDVAQFARLSKWTVRFLNNAGVAMWILEQIPRVAPYIVAEAPHLQIIDLYDYGGTLCHRRRCIASSHDLKFQKHQGPRLSLQDYLDKNTTEFHKKPVVVRTSFYGVSDASEPTPTVTSSPFRIGEHLSEARPVTVEETEVILGVEGLFKWPPDTSITQKRRDLAQIVPPKPAIPIFIAAQNRLLRDYPHIDFSCLRDDVTSPVWDPHLFLRRLPDRYRLNQLNPFIEPTTRKLYWLNDGAALPREKLEMEVHLIEPEASLCVTAEGSSPFSGEATPSTEKNEKFFEPDEVLKTFATRAARRFMATTRKEVEKIKLESLKRGELNSTEAPEPKTREWVRQPYEDFIADAPWIGKPTDERGNPLPLHPPHLPKDGTYRVTPPTEEKLEQVLKIIGVTDNMRLEDLDRLFLRHAVSYAWAAFDDTMRPVDGPAISLRFKDRDQIPIKLAPYRLTPEKLECLRKQIAEWEADGILRKGSSASPWAFPCLLLPKKGGTPGTSDAYRTVVDFRALNRLLEDDSYPLPHLGDAVTFLAGKKFQSTADLRWGYHNCKLSEDDYDTGDGKRRSWSSADVVTFSSPLGTRTYLRIPLGVKVAGMHFNRQSDADFADFLYRDLWKFVDDLMIANEEKVDHLRSLSNVFVRLAEKGYSVKPKKMKVLPESCEYLGHESGPEGMRPLQRGIEALKKMPVPKMTPDCDRARVLKQLRSFLGLASYNRRYVESFSKVAAPLNRLLEKNAELKWTPECQQAWDTIISAIAESRGVFHPDYSLPFKLRVDACKDGIGAYLFQEVPVVVDMGKERKEERVIEYFSRSLPKNARLYDARKLEMLAVIEALEYFKPIFEGHRVNIESDHKNLSYLRSYRDASGQMGRWAMRLEEFNHSLNYRPGKDQPVSDCLSRNPIPQEIEVDEEGHPLSAYLVTSLVRKVGETCEYDVAMVAVADEDISYRPEEPAEEDNEEDEQEVYEPVSLQEIVREQANCDLCKRIKEHLSSPLKKTRQRVEKKFVVKDDFLARIEGDEVKLVVPASLRTRLIRQHHDSPISGHVGRNATVDQLQRRFYWPNLAADVGDYVGKCLKCLKAKIPRPRRHGLLQQAERGGDLQVLSIDLIGPLPGRGAKYVLVMIDPFSHFLTLSVLETKEAISVFEAFVKDILLKGRLPRKLIISDNGREFDNALFRKFVDLIKNVYKLNTDGDTKEYFKHLFIAVHSPQQNPVERVNRFIKDMLKTLTNEEGASEYDWPSLIPYVEYVYNKISIPGTKICPYMLRHGHEPLEPTDWQYVSTIPIHNETMRDYYNNFVEAFQMMEEKVRAAHSTAQSKQEHQYNERQVEVEYEEGDQVLVWQPNRKNKLMFSWKGPYVIAEKVNPAVYRIKNPAQPDKEPKLESIRNIIRIRETSSTPVQAPTPSSLRELKMAKFIIFRIKKRTRWKQSIYVGEVYDITNEDGEDKVCIHFYSDYGDRDLPSDFRADKELADRRIYPEWHDPDTNQQFTSLDRKKKTPRAEPLIGEFSEKNLDILASNFDMHGPKIPPSIIKKAKTTMLQRDQRHGHPRTT